MGHVELAITTTHGDNRVLQFNDRKIALQVAYLEMANLVDKVMSMATRPFRCEILLKENGNIFARLNLGKEG